MAGSEEPRREKPHELFPEWTTRPHAVKEAERGARTRPRAQPRWGLVLLCALAALAFAVALLPRPRPRHDTPGFGDALLAETARERLATRPDLAALPVLVTARDGVLVVTGRIEEAGTRRRLLDFLALTPGAHGVVDRTDISPHPEKTPP